jgi:2-keto-4-pentenoate hydratase/2-oxohepta-3-ene-1,7-dioic acid hydratase in catechol pathway
MSADPTAYQVDAFHPAKVAMVVGQQDKSVANGRGAYQEVKVRNRVPLPPEPPAFPCKYSTSRIRQRKDREPGGEIVEHIPPVFIDLQAFIEFSQRYYAKPNPLW